MPWFALSLSLSLLIPAQAAPVPPGPTLDIYFIDVEGGAATLVVTPEREAILIDSGWPGQDDRDAKRIEAVARQEARLVRIDHLITTHWHVDHFGGVAGLARRIPIDHFHDRGLPSPTAPDGDRARFPDGPGPDDPLGRAYREASQGKRTTLRAGHQVPLRGATRLTVLAASGEVIRNPLAPPNPLCADAPADLPADGSDNARSIAVRVGLGAFEFLDCGDLTWNVEKQLVCPLNQVGPIDLFQVTHHGMDISNHPTLLATIAPTVTVMNNGSRKGGSPATVRRLRAVPSIRAAYQLHASTATEPDANTMADLIANPGASEGEFIHASVPLGGETFTVQIGARGTLREFPSR